MKRYRAVLFDLDGTLTDPGEGITNSVAYALRKNGIEPPQREALYPFIGPPLYASFMKYYGFSEQGAEKAVADYREYFADRGIFENRVYEGIPALLHDLHTAGTRVLVATSKPTVFALRIVEHFSLSEDIDAVYGSELDGSRIRKEDVIAYALQREELTPDGVVMVGDRHHDIDGAAANGLPAIGVLYGYGNRDELLQAGAAHIVPDTDALRGLLL